MLGLILSMSLIGIVVKFSASCTLNGSISANLNVNEYYTAALVIVPDASGSAGYFMS